MADFNSSDIEFSDPVTSSPERKARIGAKSIELMIAHAAADRINSQMVVDQLQFSGTYLRAHNTSTSSRTQAGWVSTTPEYEQPAKRHKSDYSNTITVLVGDEEHSFTVHKDIICARSSYFQAGCSREWKEGRDMIFRLPDHEPECFLVYTHFMYTGALDMTHMNWLAGDPGVTTTPPSFGNLSKVWMLASYLCDDDLCNRVIDRVLEKLDAAPDAIPSVNVVRHVWDNTPSKSTIQRLFQDVWIARTKPKHSEYIDNLIDDHKLPDDIVRAMAKQFVRCGTTPRHGPTSQERCKYHTHDKDAGECA